MKLFIPTSSLNFTNIMSSESISPCSFYKQRNFGYQTLEKVELNSFDNSLLLYEALPEFQIPKSELVNYPMVIEVDIDADLDGLKRLKKGIWQIDRTIYLNPFSSKIYFFSLDHKRIILSRSESIAETKLVNLYWNCIQVYQAEKKEFKLKGISDLSRLNHQELENDNQKNKIKGFAYAYLIAANNSTSKSVIELKNTINKVINLSSAIVNSVSGKGTQLQNEELKTCLQRLNAYQYNDVKEYLKTVIPEQHLDIWNKLYYHFELRIPTRGNLEKHFYKLTNSKAYENSIQELKNWSIDVEKESKLSKQKFEWSNIALSRNKLTRYDDSFVFKQETKEMYQNLINDIFVSTDINESSFSSEKSNLADDITRTIKKYIGNDWENSKAKKLLNSLRRNLAGREVFHIKWDTGVISAISSFILKGEDYERLNNFLISSEIEDGRLAFGFYGCICGFANLSRVFTSNLYESDLDYLTRTYKIIYKQLHNIELSGALPKEEEPKTIIVQSKINTEDKAESLSNNDISDLIQEIENNVTDFNEIKKEKDKLFYKNEISRLYNGEISVDYIKTLEEIETPKGTIRKWKKVISYLKNKSKQTKKKSPSNNAITEQTLIPFDKSDKQLFYKDNNAFNNISSSIPTKESKSVKSEIEWIQKAHRENGYPRKDGWVKLDSHLNDEVIEHLKNNISKRVKISKETKDIMIEALKKIYC